MILLLNNLTTKHHKQIKKLFNKRIRIVELINLKIKTRKLFKNNANSKPNKLLSKTEI